MSSSNDPTSVRSRVSALNTTMFTHIENFIKEAKGKIFQLALHIIKKSVNVAVDKTFARIQQEAAITGSLSLEELAHPKYIDNLKQVIIRDAFLEAGDEISDLFAHQTSGNQQ